MEETQSEKNYSDYDYRMSDREIRLSDLKIEIAIARKDIDVIRDKVIDVHKDLEKIRGYFSKALVGAAVLVGTYFLKWLLTGGLSAVVGVGS
jgi:hypothetical protein